MAVIKIQAKLPAEILGALLQSQREEAKIKQRVMGELLGFEGPTVISHIESGTREIRLWEFIEYCKVLKIKPEEMLTEYFNQTGEVSHIWPKAEEGEESQAQNKRRRRK